MDKDNISVLAELLRKTGDELLHGDKRLILSDILLKNINKSFNILTEEEEEDTSTSFLVVKTNSSQVAVINDIQFLHDFFQKVVNVCITNESTKFFKGNMLDISKFKSLRTLELKKISVLHVCGIQLIRSQLQCIVCIHCIHQLRDLLVQCGGDASAALMWEKLNKCVFSYNFLETIDCSLHYTPVLQIIDLSHNRLKSFCVENCLPNLKYLNLNYNLLQSIPTLGKEASVKLKTLLLKNNYIENLQGLMSLKSLVELDVSCNRLCDHSVLSPLQELPLLVWLNVIGNPFSFHFQHRFRSALHLHLNAATTRFTLDCRPLSRHEKKAVYQGSEKRKATSDHQFCSDSVVSADGDDYWYQSLRSEGEIDERTPEVQTKQFSRAKRQKHQVKEAIITENSEFLEDKPNLLPGQQQHLQVKRRVEDLRQLFGEDRWLSESGAAHLKAALGLPREAPPPPAEASSSCPVPREGQGAVTQISFDSPFPSKCNSELNIGEYSKEWTQKDVLEDQLSCEDKEEDVDEEKLFTVRNASSPSNLLLLVVGVHQLLERDVEKASVRQRWDLATLQSCELLSDSETAVRLTFDVLRRDRCSRTYLLEPSEAKVLTHLLGDKLASRSLADMNQVAYRCMKCSALFSEEGLCLPSKGHSVVCPNCGSSIVCMMEEIPFPTSRDPKEQMCASRIPSSQISQHSLLSLSSSQSSIGSRNCSSAVATAPSNNKCCLEVAAIVHQADAPSASPSCILPPNASPCVSALELDRSAVSSESENATNNRFCDSDIEVISNPSQSSIEVLEGESRTLHRKCSSKEQEPAILYQEENIKTIHSVNVPSLGLTESSSSGSFTDSVCTSYETQRCAVSVPETEEHPLLSNDESEARNGLLKITDLPVEEIDCDSSLYDKESAPNLQEMFEGLLQKVDKKLARYAELKPVASKMDHEIQYSYSDFRQVDHRLRLFFLQDLFESNTEELLLLLRAEVLKPDSTRPFPGLLVISSTHMWVLEVIGIEGDSPETWLRKIIKLPLSSVNSVYPLPWAQGVGVECRESDKQILMLLQDHQRTQSFLDAAASTLPISCGVTHEPAAYHSLFIKKISSISSAYGGTEDKLHLVSLFNSFTIKAGKDCTECTIMNGVVIVRSSDILVAESNLSWLFPDTSDSALEIVALQQISDLMEVETLGCHLDLHFVDETRNKDEVWKLVFQSPACVQAVVIGIRTPWEKLFSVPLQVLEVNNK